MTNYHILLPGSYEGMAGKLCVSGQTRCHQKVSQVPWAVLAAPALCYRLNFHQTLQVHYLTY